MTQNTGRFMNFVPLALALTGALLLGGCQGSGTPGAGEKVPEGVVHQVTPEDIAATHTQTPVTGDEVVLLVNGLGCPQCSTNINKTLERVPGVTSVHVDLGSGKVTVGLGSKRKPTPHQLSEAVVDAGLTLVKIER